MLTDTQVRATKPAERPRRLADRDGLYLQIEPSGGRYWRFNYRFNGKQKTLALGVYPDVSLGKARQRLREAREQLADGLDVNRRRMLTRFGAEPASKPDQAQKTFLDENRELVSLSHGQLWTPDAEVRQKTWTG